ncbi:dual specificity protein phosphatase 22-A-like isoform X1 [Tiliqua scincoides]|uniref:dual specificity protein phosphatase 22-A-like isoform X1 n=1 Tax=Tiliqua scincoides TaxID=71010 RepID=UPI0034630AFC
MDGLGSAYYRRECSSEPTVLEALTLSLLASSQIVEGLYLGNIRDSEDRENLAKHGITHILSVHNNAKPLLEDMSYLCISASDSSSQNLIQHFKECIRFIHECRLHGGGCLIHCLAGVSRSTTILVAYLMTVTSFGWEECLAATKAVRSYVSPNFGFQQQLQEYETTLLKEHRAWIHQEYGKNPLNDQEELQHLLSQQEEKVKEQQARLREMNWINAPSPTNTASSSRWLNR